MNWRMVVCWSVAGAVFLMSIPVLGQDDEDNGVQEKEYITTWGTVGTCAIHNDLNVGNACFGMTDEKNISMEINDEFFETVRGMYRFFEGELGADQDPDLIEEGFFCTDTAVDVPENADNLIVFVDGHIPTWFECDALEGASTGTIVVADNS